MTIGQAFECELNNILDEIRAEIEKLHPLEYVTRNSYEGYKGVSNMQKDILVIIDKYKTESNKRLNISREQLKAINDFWKEYTGRELYKNED